VYRVTNVGALFCLVVFVVAEGVWAGSPMWVL